MSSYNAAVTLISVLYLYWRVAGHFDARLLGKYGLEGE